MPSLGCQSLRKRGHGLPNNILKAMRRGRPIAARRRIGGEHGEDGVEVLLGGIELRADGPGLTEIEQRGLAVAAEADAFQKFFGQHGGRRRGDERAAGGVPDEAAILQSFAFGIRERERGEVFRQWIGNRAKRRGDADGFACLGVVKNVPVLHKLWDADEAEAVFVWVGGDVVPYSEATSCGDVASQQV